VIIGALRLALAGKSPRSKLHMVLGEFPVLWMRWKNGRQECTMTFIVFGVI
jgi:hypothetical protein